MNWRSKYLSTDRYYRITARSDRDTLSKISVGFPRVRRRMFPVTGRFPEIPGNNPLFPRITRKFPFRDFLPSYSEFCQTFWTVSGCASSYHDTLSSGLRNLETTPRFEEGTAAVELQRAFQLMSCTHWSLRTVHMSRCIYVQELYKPTSSASWSDLCINLLYV